MMRVKNNASIRACVLAAALAFSLCACTAAPPTPASSGDGSTSGAVSSAPGTQPPRSTAVLCADFSAGAADAEELGLIQTKELPVSGTPSVQDLAKALSEWSGLDFTLRGAEISDSAVTVDWDAGSTLIAGLDEREQKEEFHFFDAESLNWFMMDSLARTIKANLPAITTVYYTMDGGRPLRFDNMTGFTGLPVDQPYEGSAFFLAHSGGADGGDIEPESAAMDLLSDLLGGQLQEGTALVFTGEETVEGEHCWTFSLGRNTPEKFTAEQHFAVSDGGAVYRLDIGTGEYLPYAAG